MPTHGRTMLPCVRRLARRTSSLPSLQKPLSSCSRARCTSASAPRKVRCQKEVSRPKSGAQLCRAQGRTRFAYFRKKRGCRAKSLQRRAVAEKPQGLSTSAAAPPVGVEQVVDASEREHDAFRAAGGKEHS